MNYCDKIHYNIYTTGLATFGEMVDALLAQLPQDEQILRLAFFGMPNDNEQYVSRRIMLREKIRKFYGNHEPVLSYVSQPPLNAGLILYFLLGLAACWSCFYFVTEGRLLAAILPQIYLLFHILTTMKMARINRGKELNAILGETSRNMLLFGILLTAGLLIPA